MSATARPRIVVVGGGFGGSQAVRGLDGAPVGVSGIVAWVIWLSVHLFYLAGAQNRLLVFIRWTFSFVTGGRNARIITGDPAPGREDETRLDPG